MISFIGGNMDKVLPHHGYFTIKVFDENGKEKFSERTENIMTNVGINQLGDLMIQVNTYTVKYINVGSGTNTPAVGDTELQTVALGATRQVVTSRTRSNQTVTFTLNISSSLYTRPITITELAVYFDGSGGTNGAIFARGLLSTAVTIATNDTASVTYGVLLR